MLPAAAAMAVLLLGFAVITSRIATSGLWLILLVAWFLLGTCYSAAQVPTGRLLRRSAHAQDRPSLFAAQFALSHACWLVTYPLAGWLGTGAGMPLTLLTLGLVAALGTALGFVLWPAADPETITHEHPELGSDHPHLIDGGRIHSHAFVIDDLRTGRFQRDDEGAGRGPTVDLCGDRRLSRRLCIHVRLGCAADDPTPGNRIRRRACADAGA
jgi:hypothetical protein